MFAWLINTVIKRHTKRCVAVIALPHRLYTVITTQDTDLCHRHYACTHECHAKIHRSDSPCSHRTWVVASLPLQDLTNLDIDILECSFPISSNDFQVLSGSAHIHRIVKKCCGVTGTILGDCETLQLVVELSEVGTLVRWLAPARSHHLIPAQAEKR